MTVASLPRTRNAWRMASAYVRLEAIDDLSYPMAIGFDQLAVIVPVVIQYFVAQLVPSGRRHIGGDYYTFAVIGLSVAAVLQAALSGFGRRLQRSQDQGTFETLLIEPVAWSFIPFAMNLWRITLGFVSVLVMLSVGGILGADYDAAGVPGFLAVLVLGVAACVAIGILSASLMVLAKRSAPVLTLYGLAASLLGGALFPLQIVPSWLRALSYAVPHMYVISSARAVLMAEPAPPVVSFEEAVLLLIAFTAVVLPIGTFLFSRSMQYARKMGMLSGY